MSKSTLNRLGNRTLTALEWGLRGASVSFAVLVPALLRSQNEVWIMAGATGACVGVCQGLLLLVERVRHARTARVSSEAICATLQDRINNDLAVILAAVSSPSRPGPQQLTETIHRHVGNIAVQLQGVCHGGDGVSRSNVAASPHGTASEMRAKGQAQGPV